MCNCRNESDEKIKTVLGVTNGHISNFEVLSGREFWMFEYFDDKNKRKKMPILYKHCPHCGKEYEID